MNGETLDARLVLILSLNGWIAIWFKLNLMRLITFFYVPFDTRVKANPDPMTYPVLLPTDGVNQISKEKS